MNKIRSLSSIYTCKYILITIYIFLISVNCLVAQSNYPIPYFVESEQKFGYKSADGKSVKIEPQFIEASPFQLKTARVKNESGYFLINKKGKPTSKIYQFIGWSNDSLLFTGNNFTSFKKNNKWGILTPEGTEYRPSEFYDIKLLNELTYAFKNEGGQWGVMNFNNEILNKAKFDSIGIFTTLKNENIAIVKQDERYGLLTDKGEIKNRCIYKNITIENGNISYSYYKKWELTDSLGKVVNTLYFDELKNIGPNKYKFRINNESGIINSNGELLVKNKYDSIGHFHDVFELALTYNNKKVGLIDQNANEIFPPLNNDVRIEKNGFVTLINNGIEKYFNEDFKEIDTSDFDEVLKIKSGYYQVKKNGLWGLLDNAFEKVIECKYEKLQNFNGKYTAAKDTSGFYGVIDIEGKWVISPVLDSACVFNDKVFTFWENNISGTINPDGIELFQVKGNLLVREKYILIERNNKYGIIGEDGFKKLDILYDSISDDVKYNIVSVYKRNNKLIMDISDDKPPVQKLPAHIKVLGSVNEEGYFPAKIYENYGFVDYIGRIWISNQYAGIKKFSEGVVSVKLGSHWGVINKYEKLLIQPYYDDFSPFMNERSIVKRNGKFGLITVDGDIKIPIEFDKIEVTKNGNWLCYQKGKIGVYSSDGTGGIYPKYDFINDLKNGYVISSKNKKFGLDKFSGVNIIYHKYDQIIYNPYDNTYSLISDQY